MESIQDSSLGYLNNTVNKLRIFNSNISEIKKSQFILFRAYPYIEAFNLEIYDIQDNNGAIKHLLEILDIGVHQKYRGKGIGKQMMYIIEDIARKNNVEVIMAELQKEREGEPLYKTKNFYQQHGYSLIFDQRSNHSGWIAKKKII